MSNPDGLIRFSVDNVADWIGVIYIRAFLNGGDASQAFIVDMIDFINNPETSDSDRDGALSMVRDVLFPRLFDIGHDIIIP